MPCRIENRCHRMETVITVLQAATAVIFAGCMIYAAVSDLRTFEIPNWVSGLVLATFVVIAATGMISWPDLQASLIASLIVFLVGFALFALGYFGAGDVKLLAAISLWMGWPLLGSYLILMVFSGGLLCLMLVVFRRITLSPRLAGTGWVAQLHSRRKEVPYAVAISLTAVFFIPKVPVWAELAVF